MSLVFSPIFSPCFSYLSLNHCRLDYSYFSTGGTYSSTWHIMYATSVASRPLFRVVVPGACTSVQGDHVTTCRGSDTIISITLEDPQRLELCPPLLWVCYGSSSRYPRKGGARDRRAQQLSGQFSPRNVWRTQHAATKQSNKTLARERPTPFIISGSWC